MIQSLLDNDLYKFTMQQAVLHQEPGAHAKYMYIARTPVPTIIGPLGSRLRHEIGKMCRLRFTSDELGFLETLPFMKPDYIDFLRLFHFQEKYITIKHTPNKGALGLEINGPWLHTILFEVPLLAMISELYAYKVQRDHEVTGVAEDAEMKFWKKLASINFNFADFGTRRRFSREWHEWVVKKLTPVEGFVGTSNVKLAMENNIKPIGTMAHEWLQAGQQVQPSLLTSQRFMFQKWADEYRGDLGIALTDTIGVNAFMHDFDLYFQKLYDGVRHDSGNPIEWGWKMIKMYTDSGIDPKTKQLIFSDNLDFKKAAEINKTFKDHAKVSFGIGTFLTHDCKIKPSNHVIKMVECNHQPVAKISDDPGKETCFNRQYLFYLKSLFKE